MKFEEVLPALREGKKITNSYLKHSEYKYIYYKYGTIFNSKGGYWNLTDSEIVNNDDWEIAKEPKKVKLRDISSEKLVKNIPKWLCARFNCEDCPLLFVRKNKNKYVSCNDWARCKDLYSDKFLDQEIEVEE